MTTVALVVLLVLALAVAFELVLWFSAALLFTHIDTPACAGPDPFCRPSGRPRLTGGAGLIIGGHVGALLVAGPLVLLARWSARRSR